MTPKEKAIELCKNHLSILSKHNNIETYISIQIKELATKCVDEIIEEYEGQIFRRGLKNITTQSLHGYWQEVKEEINKI